MKHLTGKIEIRIYRETSKGKARVVSSVAMSPEQHDAYQALKEEGVGLNEILNKGLEFYSREPLKQKQSREFVLPPPNYPLTMAEIDEITAKVAESLEENIGWNWDERKQQEEHELKEKHPLPLRHLHPEFFTIEDYERAKLPKHLWEKLENCCPENDPDFLKPLNLKAEQLLEEKFKERFLKPVAGEWTLKEICERLREKEQRFPKELGAALKKWTIKEIAGELNLPYQIVYNKIIPLLTKEGDFTIEG